MHSFLISFLHYEAESLLAPIIISSYKIGKAYLLIFYIVFQLRARLTRHILDNYEKIVFLLEKVFCFHLNTLYKEFVSFLLHFDLLTERGKFLFHKKDIYAYIIFQSYILYITSYADGRSPL